MRQKIDIALSDEEERIQVTPNKAGFENLQEKGTPDQATDELEYILSLGASVDEEYYGFPIPTYEKKECVWLVDITDVDSNIDGHSRLREEFQDLAERWRKETMLSSSVEDMVMHPCYQRIIGMGSVAIPLLLQQLRKEPDHWFWALQVITGVNPVDPEVAGEIPKMTEAWIEWGKEHGYI